MGVVLFVIGIFLVLVFIALTIKKKCVKGQVEGQAQEKDASNGVSQPPPQPSQPPPQPRPFLPTKGQNFKHLFKTVFLPRFNRQPSTFRPNAVHPEPTFES